MTSVSGASSHGLQLRRGCILDMALISRHLLTGENFLLGGEVQLAEWLSQISLKL